MFNVKKNIICCWNHGYAWQPAEGEKILKYVFMS